MLITTQGIVFRTVKYRETSIITAIYTRQLGLTDFIANNVRSSKSKFNIGYFEPLSLLELTAYYQPGRQINRLTELKALQPLHHTRQDIFKSTMVVFLAEILNKCIVEHDNNPALFDFISSAIGSLENTAGNNNFHLQFLLKLTHHLGFGLPDTDSFISQAVNPAYYRDAATSRLLQQLWQADFTHSPALNTAQRQVILQDILHYYRHHIELSRLRSLDVLQAVFNA